MNEGDKIIELKAQVECLERELMFFKGGAVERYAKTFVAETRFDKRALREFGDDFQVHCRRNLIQQLAEMLVMTPGVVVESKVDDPTNKREMYDILTQQQCEIWRARIVIVMPVTRSGK